MESGKRPTPRPDDSVELRARRDGNSVVLRVTRAAAEAERVELEVEGWSVEIVEVAAGLTFRA
jgi:hypothetical protein